MDKKYYEDKMREILERDDRTEEAIRTAEELMFLEIQYCLDNQFQKN